MTHRTYPPKNKKKKNLFYWSIFSSLHCCCSVLAVHLTHSEGFSQAENIGFSQHEKNTPAAHDMQGGKWKHSKWTGKNCFFFCLTFAHADCMIRPKTRPDKKFLHTILSSFSDWKHKLRLHCISCAMKSSSGSSRAWNYEKIIPPRVCCAPSDAARWN